MTRARPNKDKGRKVYNNKVINMWYLRFIVHKRSGQISQKSPVQVKETEVLKRGECVKAQQ